MITVQGLVPYPPTADGRPIQALAANLRQFSTSLQQTSSQLTGTAAAARSSWTGAAAEAFGSHVDERARTVSSIAQCVGRTVPVLDTFAGAIDSTAAAYSVAATQEHIARAGLPWTSGALAAAISAEWAALGALQAAGAACAGALAAIELEIAAAQFFGVDRQMFTSIKDTVMQAWQGVQDLVEHGDSGEDDAKAAVEALDSSLWMSSHTALGSGATGPQYGEADNPYLGGATGMPGWLLNGDQTVAGALELDPGGVNVEGDTVVVGGVNGAYARSDGSFQYTGDSMSGHLNGEVLLGAQRAYDASVRLGNSSSVTGTGSTTAGAYAAMDTAFNSDENGASVSASVEALAGVKGEHSVGLDVDGAGSATFEAEGRAGAWADAEADAFFQRQEGGGFSVGASAGASAAALAAEGEIGASVDVGDGLFGGHVAVDGDVGLIADASGGFQADLGWDRVGLAVSGEVAAGVGLGADVGVYFSPSGVADAAVDGYTYAAEAVAGGVETLSEWANDTGASFAESMPWNWSDDE